MASRRKITAICTKCNTEVSNIKDILKCFTCHKIYDLECANVTSKRFHLMSKEKKQKWNCKSCIERINEINKNKEKVIQDMLLASSSTVTPDTEQYVTLRKNKDAGVLNISLEDMQHVNSNKHVNDTFLDESTHSLPNISIGETSQITHQRLEIEELNDKLSSANNEIDKLNTENEELKKKNTELQKSVDLYKKILSSPDMPSRNCTPKKLRQVIDINVIQKSAANTPSRPRKHEQIEEDMKLQMDKKKHIDNLRVVQTTSTPKSRQGSIIKEKIHSKKIVIIGGGQCRNLASNLITSRINTKYENYNIVAFLKPEASAETLLESCKNADLTDEDILVLSLGQDDADPVKLSMDMYSVLKDLRVSNIFLMSILKNKYLNEDKLNTLLKGVSKKISKCNFIEIDKYAKNVTREMCNKINFWIDTYDYNNIYLPRYVKEIDRLLKNGITDNKIVKDCQTVPRRGTIPYYFRKIDVYKKDEKNSTTEMTKKKKTTIPDYFETNTERKRDHINHIQKDKSQLLKKQSDDKFFRF